MNTDSILKRTKSVEKTYTFNEDHNPRIPADYWFQNTIEGNTLFIVFYTQACRYSKCEGCNLPSLMSLNHVDFQDIMKQIDAVFHNILDNEIKLNLDKIIISNNGSILDEETFSTTALIYLVSKINMECPKVKVVTIETRPEYVDVEELEVLSRALHEGLIPTSLEIAIGFEAFDETIRNEYFKKGLQLSAVETLLKKIAQINKCFHNNYKGKNAEMKLKTYFMLKPISHLSNEQAIEDIKNGIDYLNLLSSKYNVAINMHLNPTYVAKGTNLEREFFAKTYTPPTLAHVLEAVRHAENKNISIYIGLSDEGLAVNEGSFFNEENEDDLYLFKKLDDFNRTQSYELLK